MGTKNKEKIDKDITQITENKFERKDIADISEEWIKVYATNVNIARITPHAIDGLKPGARRMLYSMKNNASGGTKFIKLLRSMSDTVQYHPHGDTSVSDVIYRYGQPWKNSVTLIDKQGNYGNIKGLPPAHPRYTECKLSDAAQCILFADIKDSNVPMRTSYDGESKEPDYLPARIPLVLCNPGFSSIGIGVSSNIPPFNMHEVIEATIKLIKNPDAKIMLLPDSPTGCNIIDDGQFGIVNDVGGAPGLTLSMSATYEIDYVKNIITITSIPLQQSTNAIISRLVEMRKAGKKKMDELVDIVDDTSGDTVDLKLFLSSSSNPDEFMRVILTKKTGLKDTYPIEIRVIDDFKSHVWGVKELLLRWIEYRQECVRATYNKKLMDATNKHHMNEVYLMVFSENNIEKTGEIARTSANTAEMAGRFMKAYGITSLQANTLCNMGYKQFSKEAYQKFKEVKVETEKQMKEYQEIILDDGAVDEVIIAQMKEIDQKFGTPRKSAIIKAGEPEEKIPNVMYLIGISRDGYIKKVSPEESASIGAVGKTTQVIVTLINNRDNLLIFGDDGRMSRIGVSSIPEMNYDDPGIELSRYYTLTGAPVSVLNEKATADGIGDIVIVTKKGFGKKVKMSEFAKIKDFKDVINLSEGDSLVAAIPAGEEDFVIYTNFGDGIRLNTSSIKYQGRNAKGLSLITLRKNEEVVGINFMESGCDKLLYVTSAGRLKMTEGKLLPLMDRRSDPIALIALEPNEYLVGVSFVSVKDSVIIYRRKSEPVELPLTKVKVTTRIAKPEKLIKTPSGDAVTGFKVVRN